jgi:hypothetical protein
MMRYNFSDVSELPPSCRLLTYRLYFGIFSGPKDGGSTLFRNDPELIVDNTAYGSYCWSRWDMFHFTAASMLTLRSSQQALHWVLATLSQSLKRQGPEIGHSLLTLRLLLLPHLSSWRRAKLLTRTHRHVTLARTATFNEENLLLYVPCLVEDCRI